MSRKVLFITPQTIKERTGLHANVDEKLVNPEILTTQDMYILPALGTALYVRLQDGIENNNLTDKEQELLDTYITPALVHFVLSELPMGISFQFYNKGLIRKTGTDQTEPNVQDIIDVSNRYKARAEFYKNRMMLWVKETASKGVHFQEYINPGTGIDIVHPDNEAYTTSIYLGDDCGCKPKRFEEIYQGDTFRTCNEQ
jgi:hypothetical protein